MSKRQEINRKNGFSLKLFFLKSYLLEKYRFKFEYKTTRVLCSNMKHSDFAPNSIQAPGHISI